MATILVVDDEPTVLSLCQQMLQRSGYSVVQANSGEKALRLARDPMLADSRAIPSGLGTVPLLLMPELSERSIMNQSGHRSVQMVRRYIRDGSLFRENSGGRLGL